MKSLQVEEQDAFSDKKTATQPMDDDASDLVKEKFPEFGDKLSSEHPRANKNLWESCSCRCQCMFTLAAKYSHVYNETDFPYSGRRGQ